MKRCDAMRREREGEEKKGRGRETEEDTSVISFGVSQNE
jgi:hypothetical protein